LLKESDWFDINNRPINQSTYESHDAPNIYGPIKRELAARLDANLRAANPMPVWLFVGSSEMTAAQDANGQKGYRLISTTGKTGIGNIDHIIMGVLCPADE
jgi:hypothetical protein